MLNKIKLLNEVNNIFNAMIYKLKKWTNFDKQIINN